MPVAAPRTVADAWLRGPGPLWLPGEAERLARGYWSSHRSGLDRDSYGTSRWLAGNTRPERLVLASVTIGVDEATIEGPDADLAARYAPLGLELVETLQADSSRLFARAIALLDTVPGLIRTIGALVRSIHVVTAQGPGYDTSHSDPALPFSIFVSVPVDEPGAALRLAESLLHEAMHLQLSLIEHTQPLVADTEMTGYSPWKQCERPAGGLLHGLYVFTVIHEVLGDLLERQILGDADRALAALRRAQIAVEIAELGELGRSKALTSLGRVFTRRLLASSPALSGSRTTLS